MSDNYSQERRDPQRRKKAKEQEAAPEQRSVRQQSPVQGQNNKRQQSPAREQQLTEEQIERRRRRREAARRKREQQVRTRLAVLAVIIVFALAGIGALAFRIHKRNVLEEQAALAASLETQREQEEAALEASRKAAEEAAVEASRKAAEEAALEASRQAAEEAALEASRKAAAEEAKKAADKKKEAAATEASRQAAEEAGALAASRKAAEEEKAKAEAAKIPGLNPSYDFKATDKTEDVPEDIDSEYAVIVDLVSGNVIAGRDYDTEMYPASMTKILTLLVAVENINLKKLDTDTYEIHQGITDYVYTHEMSQVGWDIGDEPTIRSLLYGTILPSGADAALALAEYTAGSEEDFVELMNKKLKELGISDTAHFTNVVGAFDEDHYCTCLDMATILRAAIDNELCREVLSCHYYEVERSLDEDSEMIGISNWFLRRIEDKDTHGEVVCGKTGYVSEAGFCAASYQESDDGGHYICVTADGPGIWPCIYDHVELYETYTE